MNIIQRYEAEQIARLTATRGVPDFAPGDTVRVAVKVVEGERTRTQAFEGVCIGRSNKGLNSNFTVRKISYGEGVERVFPLYSPLIAEIAVVRRGDVRRAKLYYLRGRSGKSARIAERARTTGPAGEPPPRTKPKPPTDNRVIRGKDAMSEAKPRTLFDKIWDSHVVEKLPDGTCILYIDRHLLHEVTSPQAFEGLRVAGRKLRRPDLTIAVADHNIPTVGARTPSDIKEEDSRIQVQTLEKNVVEFGVPYIPILDVRQGIVHIIGPELGISLPGTTIVCGDLHTSTHGAMGALAFGIGTSEVEHVMATQTLLQQPAKNMEVRVDGTLGFGCSGKDIVLAIIGKIGTAGGTGHVIEYTGEAIRALDMAGRMTVSNMSIEAGARAGLIAPDETTFAYVKGREFAPKGEAWEQAVAYWRTLPTDPGAHYDTTVMLNAADIAPMVTWGTNPGAVVPVTGVVPDPAECRGRRPADADAADAGIHGAEAWPEAGRCADRRGVHRMLHQRAHRGHPCRRRRRQGPKCRHRRAGVGGAGVRAGEEAGRGRGAGSHPAGGGVRVARPVLLDVPRDEPGQAEAWPALRQHVEPQFRGAAGAGRADAPGVAGDGGGRGGDRAAGGCEAVGVTEVALPQPRHAGRRPGIHVLPSGEDVDAGAEPRHDSNGQASGEIRIKVAPFRIDVPDQPCLPGARPLLDVLLSLDCVCYVFVPFEIDEPVQPVSFREAGYCVRSMLERASDDVVGDADVQRAIWPVGHDVDPSALHDASMRHDG